MSLGEWSAFRTRVVIAVPTWIPTGSPDVEKMLGSGNPSGVVLPVLYLSPLRQSMRIASNASR